MGLPSDDIVVIRLGQKKGDPGLITVNCPDKLGLGADLARLLFDFSLHIVRGDMSTDGKWCFGLFWVVPIDGCSKNIRWADLKKRLVSACPSTRPHLLLPQFSVSRRTETFLLQTSSLDKDGLLHDISQVLWELELIILKMNATVTPDGKALNLFHITDSRELLQEKRRQDDLCFRIRSVLGGVATSSCTVELAGTKWGMHDCTGCCNLSSMLGKDPCCMEASGTSKVTINLDNSLSPGHTLLQISCKDRKGLIYDCMQTLKDFQIQIAYGRIDREIDFFVFHGDGKKIVDSEKQKNLCARLELEIMQPIRVIITCRGPDTELLVAVPVKISGQSRPRVLYDTTCVLKSLGICIFKADIGLHMIEDRQCEVHRFLLVDKVDLDLTSSHSQARIAEQVKKMLIG